MQQATTDSGPWTRFWRGGALHSCGQGFAGNYEGAIARFWQAQFAALPDDALLVDVGTGNGAIPRLAHDAAAALGRRWRIHGTDLAHIDPVAHAGSDAARYTDLVFHPATAMSQLPFEAGSVALVTSQYALEYTDMQASLREFARVLAPGGRIAFVLHRRDSVVLRAAAPQIEDCDFLFAEARLHQRARELATYLARAVTPAMREALAQDAAAQRSRAKVNESADMIVARIERSPVPGLLQTALAHASEVFRNAHAWGELRVREYLAWSEQALRDEAARLRQLQAAALDGAAVEGLARTLSSLGFADAAVGELQHAPAMPMGWTLTARCSA